VYLLISGAYRLAARRRQALPPRACLRRAAKQPPL